MSAAPPGRDPTTVARVRRRTQGWFFWGFFWVEFGLVCDGTEEASWHGDGRRLHPSAIGIYERYGSDG